MRPRRSLAFCSESADTYFSGGQGGEKKKKSFSPAPLKNGAVATKHNDGGLFTEGDASEVSMAFPFAAASRWFFRDAEDLFRSAQVQQGRHFQGRVGGGGHAKNRKKREVKRMKYAY